MPHQAQFPHGQQPPVPPHLRGPHPLAFQFPPGTPLAHQAEMARLAAAHQASARTHALMYGRVPHPALGMPGHPGHVPWRNPSYETPYGMPIDMRMRYAQEAHGPLPMGMRPEAYPVSPEDGGALKRQRAESSFADEQEAVSALLMSAGGKPATQGPFTAASLESKLESEVNKGSITTPLQRKEPLKKRKIHLEESATAPSSDALCHVSPVSNASLGTAGDGHSEETPSEASQRTPAMSSRTDSFDMKEAEALTESAKIRDAAEIAPPPAQVNVPHFPSLLHDLLSDKHAENIVQWTGEGQAWRIIRWDAFSRAVLPAYFPQLSEGASRGGYASVDAFLWHVRAWGFDEIKDGPNAGAYWHMNFVRDNPQLCQRMQFHPERGDAPGSPSLAVSSGSHGAAAAGSYDSPYSTKVSVLQVPSLASSRSDGTSDTKVSNAHYVQHAIPGLQMAVSHPPTQASVGSPYRPAWPQQAAFAARSIDEFESPRTSVMFPPAFDPRYPFRNAQQQQYQQSPPQPPRNIVRSTRGGARMASMARNYSSGHESVTSPQREDSSSSSSSFPVSQRGKGLRGRPKAAAASIVQTSTSVHETIAEEPSQQQAQPIVRKAKPRQLPLARHRASAANDRKEEEEA